MKAILQIGLLLALSYFGWHYWNTEIRKDTAFAPRMGYITDARVQIRAKPDQSADPKGELSRGDSVFCIKKSKRKTKVSFKNRPDTEGYWYEIDNLHGTKGWVFEQLIGFKKIAKPEIAEVQLPPPPDLYRPQYLAQPTKWDNLKNQFLKHTGRQVEKEMVQLIEACDFENPKVRNKAVRVAAEKDGSGSFNLAQVCNLYDYAAKNWRYVNDPAAREYVAKASESLETQQTGDCDDFAVLMASLILAIGGETRINYASGSDGGHAFAEVKLGDYTDLEAVENYIALRYNIAQSEVHSRDNWLNLDWFDQPKRPGGTYFDWRRINTFYILDQRFE